MIGLGSWVRHPARGLGQVADVWVLDESDIERPATDDGFVLVALEDGTGCFRAHRESLSPADEPVPS